MYIDFHGPIQAINHSTGETAELTFYERSWTTDSKIEGSIMDSSRTKVYEIHGSWITKIFLKDLRTNSEIVIVDDFPRIPDSNRQFFFNQLSVNLNYVDQDMLQVIAPTDTRLRGD